MNKRSSVRMALALCAIGFSVLTLNAFWVLNEPPPSIPTLESETSRDQVVQSASLLLQSNADASLFMSEVEEAEVRPLDVALAGSRLQLALEKVALARAAMERVIRQAQRSDVPAERRRRLRDFDYSGLSGQYHLNGEIMGRVSRFLARGDLVGLYCQHVNNLRAIEAQLARLGDEIRRGRRPDNDSLWPLLRLYSETLLMANYATLVFYQA